MLDIPIEVKKTVGTRRTREISDLGWNRNPYLYIMSFKELLKSLKKGHQGKFVFKSILAQLYLLIKLHDAKCRCCYAD